MYTIIEVRPTNKEYNDMSSLLEHVETKMQIEVDGAEFLRLFSNGEIDPNCFTTYTDEEMRAKFEVVNQIKTQKPFDKISMN